MAEYTQEQQDEFARCANDFPYFCEKYIKVIHLKCGLIPLSLHEYQHRLFQHCESNRFTLVKKFRQGGFTTLMAAYTLWKCLFKLDQSIMFQTRTDREACWTSDIVRTMIQYLPDWMKPELRKDNDHLKQFTDTNSKLMFHTPEAACGKAISLLVIEEAAFIRDMDKHWKAMYPTLSCGGACIVQSTPNGKWSNKSKEEKTWFYQLYEGAKKGTNTFAVFEASFKENPEFRSEAWETQMKENLGEKGWAQEYEMVFLD